MNAPDKVGSTIDLVQTVTRPVVTFMFTAAICWGFINGIVGGETFTTLVSVVITFWFAQRGQDKRAADAPSVTATAPPGGTAAASVTPPNP